jgi:two-component system nitrogen regulation sensor histidine kinase NtrY
MQTTVQTISREESLKREESKRRRRELIVIMITALMVAALIYFEVRLPDVSAESSNASNIAFFLLINVNIILLGLLVFLVVRNLIKLIVERRQRIMGSRLQGRLVLAFVSLSLVPSVLLFAIAGGLLTRSFDRWFDSKVDSALQGSLEIGQTYYQNSANNAIFYARQLSQRLTAQGLVDGPRTAELERFVREKQREYNLGTVEILAPDGEPLIVAVNEQVPTGGVMKAEGEFLQRALRGLEVTRTEILGDADVIRGGVPLYSSDRRIRGAVVVDYYVPKSISKRAVEISQSYEQYKYLTFLKTPVKNSYLLTLLLITLVVVLAATWCGMYISRGITVPIQKLAEGTHEVAQGNWDYRIEGARDDEIGVLMNSFNQMTGDLKQIKLELEHRGTVVETLLANIAAAVVSVDPAGRITTWNKAAENILAVAAERALGRPYQEVFQSEPLAELRAILDSAMARESVEREVRLTRKDRLLTIMVNAASLRDDDGSVLGVMLFLEDITQIQQVQRMEAWREVARRIAHEIKNPLTPIQLSAERLRKRYATMLDGDGAIFDKCTSTIIQQVVELKNLVNEFAQFARLPSARLARADLNEVVAEALVLFKEGHQGVRFQFRPGEIPVLDLDREQIKRVLINLLDNAVAAVDGDGAVTLATTHDPARAIVTLEVIDNGCGLPAEIRAKIFEPYFSTKENGTGLGLTIVGQIIEDHRAYIRAWPNEPRGTRFTIEFPVRAGALALEDSAKRAVHS